ncbi:hypothetical protein K1719_033843 [Acacia pycnantha]|nr:hypothetical protein K1719_033843 [Acacia pycnantha]
MSWLTRARVRGFRNREPLLLQRRGVFLFYIGQPSYIVCYNSSLRSPIFVNIYINFSFFSSRTFSVDHSLALIFLLHHPNTPNLVAAACDSLSIEESPLPWGRSFSRPSYLWNLCGGAWISSGAETALRKAIGREPSLSFPRACESPAQWIDLLNVLEQQELPGWPLLSPLKVQLQKCEKCSREFCSSINYRRHIRAHHRLKKTDKDSTKNRDMLGAYWDKLSVEEATEVVSFKNVMLEEVPGSSILKALTNLVRKQGFSSLPQNYLKAGSALLDIVQARSSILSLSSKELFGILDSASEKTFLCGAAVSMQKYIFYGEPGKTGLESKNLVACASFLLEQKLVKAWLADKEAEALRCEKLLVEEEEAAQKRQAEILERKRQKKLRQKEQKARGQKLEDEAEMKKNGSSTAADSSLAEAFPDTRDSGEHSADTFAVHGPSPVPFHCTDTNEGADGDSMSVYDYGTDQNIEQETSQGHVCQHVVVAQPKSQWAVANGFHANHNSQFSKPGVIQKYESHRNQKAAPMLNGNKVWSRKHKQKIIEPIRG